MAKLVSKTYGEALFDLAVEEHALDALADEAKVVLEAFRENPELSKLLNHPKIVKEEKISVVENIFKGRASDHMVGFLTLIVEKDRYNELEAIIQYFLDKVREEKNIGVAYVTSAVPLEDAQKEQIRQKLLHTTKYTEFEMIYKEDKSLIGGLIIRVGDRVVDSSIRSRINHLSKELYNISLGNAEA